MPDELGDVARRGPGGDLGGGAGLGDAALLEDDQAVGEHEGVDRVVGDEQAGARRRWRGGGAARRAPATRVLASRAARGSSSSSSRGSVARARARATRWAWPPDSVRGLACGVLGEAEPLEPARGLGAGRSALRAPRARSPKATLSSAVSRGNSR